MKYVVAAIPSFAWAAFYSAFAYDSDIADNDARLRTLLASTPPQYVFFPHWRTKVPDDIVRRFECVGFHTADLPSGRGGSPIQNQIARGVKLTVLTAYRMTEDVDAGPVYLKRPFSLEGTLPVILERLAVTAAQMAARIIKEGLVPVPQEGPPSYFKRRRPSDSLIPITADLERFWDWVRMLDHPDYPAAFIRWGKLRIRFEEVERGEGGRVGGRFVTEEIREERDDASS
ncbi:MAG: methionyl-tRNA formyltransferase [Dehalococcoidia bacterium]|nr:methionyl-tRNA formyltransferase [Dehalococcoidia bacterium]